MISFSYRRAVSVLLAVLLISSALYAQTGDAELEQARKTIAEQKDKPTVSPQLITWILGGGSAALLGGNIYFASKSKKLAKQLAQNKEELNHLAARMEKMSYQVKPMYETSEAYLKYFNAELDRIADHYVYSVPRYVQSRHPSLWKTMPVGREKETLHLAQSALETVFSNMHVTEETVLLTNETPRAYFKRVIEPKVDSLVRYMLARHYQYYGAIKTGSRILNESVGVTGRNMFKVMPSASKAVKVLAPVVLVAWGFTAAQASAKDAAVAQRLLENPELFLNLPQEDFAVLEKMPPLRQAYITLAQSLEQFDALSDQDKKDILNQAQKQETLRRQEEKKNLIYQMRQVMSR